MVQQGVSGEIKRYKKSFKVVVRIPQFRLSYLTELFYCLFFVLKPFYLKPSGTVQMADVCLAIAFMLYFVECIVQGRVKDFKVIHYFYLSVIGILCVNAVYAVKLQESSFFVATAYWIFNLLFLLLSYVMLNDRGSLKKIIFTFKFSICIQSIIVLFHWGRWIWGVRYAGSFNDPNQFAFYMLMCGLSILIYEMHACKYTVSGCLCIIQAVFLIIKSSSRGMTLCVALVLFFEGLNAGYQFLKKNRKSIKRKQLFYFAVGAVVLAVGLFIIVRYKTSSSTYDVWDRWADTISSIAEGRGLTSNGKNAFAERGIDRVWKYPEYLLLGAGEGGFDRFKTLWFGEIHSTFLGILFCYGVFTFLMISLWCFHNIKKLDGKYLAVYLALVVESFTLVHYRQPIFWLLFVIGWYIQKNPLDESLMRGHKTGK